jgi:hypothetical protein
MRNRQLEAEIRQLREALKSALALGERRNAGLRGVRAATGPPTAQSNRPVLRAR